MASRFEPSVYSNPDREEPAMLIVMRHNPTSATSSSVRWEAPDGRIVDLAYVSHEITLVAPEKSAGIRLKPGTVGYKDYIEAMAADWDKNASAYETYINWPQEREEIEDALNAAIQAMPEKDSALDAQGNQVKAPGAPGQGGNLGLYLAAGILGTFVIGGVIYAIVRSSSPQKK